MSGPKVVRVISLEEKQQTVKKHQAQMLFALNKLKQFASANQQLVSPLSEVLAQRQAQFEALNESDFENIEAMASEQIGFLNAQRQELENDLIKQKQQRKHRIRQIKMAAKGFEQVYQQRQHEIPEALAQLTTLPLDTKLEQLQQHEEVLQTALESLTQQSVQQSNAPLTGELLALQSRLKTEGAIQPLESWISTQKPVINKQQQRLDTLLSRLELMRVSDTQQSALQAFIDRAETLEQAHSNSAQSQHILKLDSLLLDVSQFIQQQQTVQDLKESLQQALETIQEVIVVESAESAAVIVSRLQTAISASNITPDALEQVLEESQAFILTQEKALAAQSRRQAVLQGLSELGYQVTENMSTAWVENGRLVVRKASADDYGIELTTNPEMQRLQARVVVNHGASQRNADSDIQAEEVWCGDFSSLRQMIEAQQGEIIVDKALPIGSQKLKEVSQQDRADEERLRQYQHQRGKLRAR